VNRDFGPEQKHPVMGCFCIRSIAVCSLFLLWISCAPTLKTLTELSPDDTLAGLRSAIVVVASENVRQYPNGPIIGKIISGVEVTVVAPRGNWMLCNYSDSLEGWIWAPSLGFEQLDFFQIQTYFRSPDYQLIPVVTMTERLGLPSRVVQESPHYQRLVYDNSFRNDHFPYGTRDFKQLELVVVHPGGLIAEVHIDLGKKEAAQSEMLLLLGLANTRPNKSGFQKVVWDNAYPGLGRVVLERFQGSFTSFSWIRAYKINPEAWKDDLSIIDQSCQIGNDNVVNFYLALENNGDMAYSDVQFRTSFYQDDQTLTYQKTIGPISDIIPSHASSEIFATENIPRLAGRSDLNYVVDLVSARPLFISVTP
jgi:hypothetical protein